MSPLIQPPAVRLGEPLVLQAYPKMVCWHKFTPDGKLLVVTGFGGAKLYRTDDWTQVADLEGHTQAVSSGALSQDGKILATASTDTTVRLWSLPAGGLIDTLKLHKKTVAAVEFSPDGRLLATGSYDARATLYDLEAASPRATLKGHKGNVVSLA
ncbi:MAG: WD40 repeat domain-containing protein, partial [Caldilineaceae bacterium]